MPPTFPRHSLFTAARLERRIPSRSILIFSRISGIGFIVLFIAYAFTGAEALAGLGFAAASAWLAAVVWARFISFHRGRWLVSLPEDVSSLAGIDLAGQWPFCIDFDSALIFAGVKNPEDPDEIVNCLFDAGGGKFFLERIGVSKDDFLAIWNTARRNSAEPHLNFTGLVKAAAEHAVRNHRPFISPADILAGVAALDKPFG